MVTRPAETVAVLLEQVVEAAPDPIWAKGLDGRFLLVNSAAARLLGHAREDIIGRTNQDLLPAEAALRLSEEDRRIITEGAQIDVEEELVNYDTGERGIYLSRKVPLRALDGTITGMLGLAREITDFKKYESTLVAREAKAARAARELQTLADNLPTLCFMAFADGPIYWFNRRCYDYTGRTWEQSANWTEAIDPLAMPEAIARWDHSRETGEPFEMMVPILGADGRYRDFLSRIVPIRNEAGAIMRWFGTLTDVTDLKAAEAARARLSSILETTSDFVGTFDAKLHLTYLNPAARRLAGIADGAALAGCALDVFYAPDQHHRLVDEVLPLAREHGVWAGETMLRRADGQIIPASEVVVAHRNERGDVDFFSVVARDMSERVASEEREKLLARELDHRAKNLLAIVQSVVQLTRADSVAELKEAITGRVQSLARAHSLLAASRWQGIELATLIAEEMAPFARADTRRVRVSGPSLLLKPAAAQAIALALHELATNTVKYGALSCDSGQLSISWRRAEIDGAPHLVLVWDERGGPQVTPPTARGFGSTVIRNGVERQLKGHVELDWRREGLRCTLTFPADRIAGKRPAPQVQTAAPRDRSDADARSVAGRKVLIVEDEGLISAQIEAVLDEAGCAVMGPAADVQEALALATGPPPDVAILDVNLAGERSDPVADALAARGIPFLFCTGYASGGAPERHRDAPVLNKPLDPAELIRAIGDLTR